MTPERLADIANLNRAMGRAASWPTETLDELVAEIRRQNAALFARVEDGACELLPPRPGGDLMPCPHHAVVIADGTAYCRGHFPDDAKVVIWRLMP